MATIKDTPEFREAFERINEGLKDAIYGYFEEVQEELETKQSVNEFLLDEVRDALTSLEESSETETVTLGLQNLPVNDEPIENNGFGFSDEDDFTGYDEDANAIDLGDDYDEVGEESGEYSSLDGTDGTDEIYDEDGNFIDDGFVTGCGDDIEGDVSFDVEDTRAADFETATATASEISREAALRSFDNLVEVMELPEFQDAVKANGQYIDWNAVDAYRKHIEESDFTIPVQSVFEAPVGRSTFPFNEGYEQ